MRRNNGPSTPATVHTQRPNSSNRRTGLRGKHTPDYKYRYGFTEVQASNKVTNEITKTWNAIDHMPPLAIDDPDPNPSEMQSIHKAMVGFMFTQMSAAKGIKKHGQVALDALRKEFEQFKSLEVLEPLDAFTMSDEHKAESLRAISVIKEKRDGTIKGRTCINKGNSQKPRLARLPYQMIRSFSPSKSMHTKPEMLRQPMSPAPISTPQ